MSKLRLIDGEQDTERSLRSEVSQVINRHQDAVIETVRRWLVYAVHLGTWQVDLAECPTVTPRDHDYVIDWLRLEGFTVQRSPGRSRVIINLRPDAHPGSGPRKRSWF